ncbi:MAG: aspartate/glutamate racemase family protein [Pseudomonadota bacterium]
MIVLINPNSTSAMTDAMASTAAAVAPDAHVEGWTSRDGPPAIQGPEDGAACVPPMLELVEKADREGAQAIIIGCADDTGLAEAREIANCPVIGIGQAAYHFAALCGPRFSVVTTLLVSVPVLEANIATHGLSANLVRVRASGVPVLDLEADKANATRRVLEEVKRAEAEDDIQSIVLGCGGMTHIRDAAPPDVSVRLVDGVETAAQLAQIMTR